MEHPIVQKAIDRLTGAYKPIVETCDYATRPPIAMYFRGHRNAVRKPWTPKE